MAIAIIVLILFLGFIFLLKSFKGFNLKMTGFVVFGVALCATVFICISQPKMHKPFSIDVIEYLIKINDDGSMTTTKQVTKTVVDKQGNN